MLFQRNTGKLVQKSVSHPKTNKLTNMKKLFFISLSFGLTFSTCDNNSSNPDHKHEETGYIESKLISDPSSDISNDLITAEGSLIPVANMQTPRAAHTATLLNNGTVLISGGFSNGSSDRLSSAEIYETSSKAFTKISDLNTVRVGHSATLLPNGKVLIAGGYNGNSLSTTEIYDPESKSFSPGPNMNTARYGHTATLLENGKILFAGGVGTGWTFLSSAELYDIQTNEFMPAKAMADAREAHTATLLSNGNVLIAGGHRDRRENIIIYTSAEIYDSKSNLFIAAGSMNVPRHKHDAVLLSDGKVLITGGSDKNDSLYISAEIFDPVTARFSSISNMNYARFKHRETSILLPDNNILIGGGADKAEIYNFKTGIFIPLRGNLGATRLFSSATLLDNGSVLISGGYDENIRSISEACLFVK